MMVLSRVKTLTLQTLKIKYINHLEYAKSPVLEMLLILLYTMCFNKLYIVKYNLYKFTNKNYL